MTDRVTAAKEALKELYADLTPNYSKKTNRLVELYRTIEAALTTLSAESVGDALPCVSCGKQSDRSTPDAADMCHACFGDFNANCYDELSNLANGLEIALVTISKESADSNSIETAVKALSVYYKETGYEKHLQILEQFGLKPDRPASPPDGFVMVPVEPTEKMMAYGIASYPSASPKAIKRIWKSMCERCERIQ